MVVKVPAGELSSYYKKYVNPNHPPPFPVMSPNKGSFHWGNPEKLVFVLEPEKSVQAVEVNLLCLHILY